jgi:hypothetical protein
MADIFVVRYLGYVEKRCEIIKPMDTNILSAICVVLVIIAAIERPASAKWTSDVKHDGSLAVYRASRPSDPMPVRNERQGAKICAIEIIPQRIRNSMKASD